MEGLTRKNGAGIIKTEKGSTVSGRPRWFQSKEINRQVCYARAVYFFLRSMMMSKMMINTKASCSIGLPPSKKESGAKFRPPSALHEYKYIIEIRYIQA